MIDYLQKFKLENKTAVVIGGMGLLGREISTAIATAGAKTILLDLESAKSVPFEQQLLDAGGDVQFRKFDCANLSSLEAEFASIVSEQGCPDVLVNCSYPRSVDWGNSSFQSITLKSFQENVNLHMNSYAWLARLGCEVMAKSNRGGSVIQLGSIYGILGQDLSVYAGTEMQENMSYAAIKGGITNLTRQMASYYGQFNVRINTLCPGGIQGHVAGKSDGQNPIFVSQYQQKTPLKRMGKPEEVASTALFLASDAASYITGATIIVDGGWSIV